MPISPFVSQLLNRASTGRLATVSGSGAPHAAPFWLAFDGERIYVDTLNNRTVRNLRRDPRVAVLVDVGDRFDELAGALVSGQAIMHTEEDAPPHVRAGVGRIRAAHAEEIAGPVFQAYAAAETRSVVLLEIVPERASSWDLGKPRSRGNA